MLSTILHFQRSSCFIELRRALCLSSLIWNDREFAGHYRATGITYQLSTPSLLYYMMYLEEL
jgi:hypothetical protein